MKFFALLALWGVAAALAGKFGLLGHLPPRLAPVLIAGLTVSFSLALARIPWLRTAVDLFSVRQMIGSHVPRFVGGYFLWLYHEGRLPAEFAQRAGWGDIAAAAGALVLLFWPEGKGFRRALFGWNALAMLDLFVAVGTAGWLNGVRPGSMAEIGQFPLALIPLWLVPVFLSNHIVLFRRGREWPRGSIPANGASPWGNAPQIQ